MHALANGWRENAWLRQSSPLARTLTGVPQAGGRGNATMRVATRRRGKRDAWKEGAARVGPTRAGRAGSTNVAQRCGGEDAGRDGAHSGTPSFICGRLERSLCIML